MDAVVDARRQDGVDLAVEPDDQCRVAVRLCRPQRRGSGDPAQPGDSTGSCQRGMFAAAVN